MRGTDGRKGAFLLHQPGKTGQKLFSAGAVTHGEANGRSAPAIRCASCGRPKNWSPLRN